MFYFCIKTSLSLTNSGKQESMGTLTLSQLW